jgi:hypothetical protein
LYKIVVDTRRHVPGAGGETFNNIWTLTESLYNVKRIKLLWARFPHVAAGIDPTDPLSGSDHSIIIQIGAGAASKATLPNGKWISTYPVKDGGAALSNQFFDRQEGAFAVLNNEGFDAGATYNFRGEDYLIDQVFPVPITQLAQLSFQFFNARGHEIGYGIGAAAIDVSMAFEIECSGTGA